MELTEYILDCSAFHTKEEAHEYFLRTLPLPDHYGKNLDALYDCLCELAPCRLFLKNRDALLTWDYGKMLFQVFCDASDAGVETAF